MKYVTVDYIKWIQDYRFLVNGLAVLSLTQIKSKFFAKVAKVMRSMCGVWTFNLFPRKTFSVPAKPSDRFERSLYRTFLSHTHKASITKYHSLIGNVCRTECFVGLSYVSETPLKTDTKSKKNFVFLHFFFFSFFSVFFVFTA